MYLYKEDGRADNRNDYLRVIGSVFVCSICVRIIRTNSLAAVVKLFKSFADSPISKAGAQQLSFWPIVIRRSISVICRAFDKILQTAAMTAERQ